MSVVFKDMIGREVVLEKVPERIVSLVPSQTELLYSLGVGVKVVGQTVFCIHPESGFKTTTKVGGTKKIKYDVIEELKPDLIICNKEENTKEIVDTLSKSYPVWVSDIYNLKDNSEMILKLGNIVDRLPQALELVKEIEKNFSYLSTDSSKSCLYLIWKGPWIGVASNTFINEMLKCAGFNNVLSHKKRYPEIAEEMMQALKPDYVLLSSEPFPFAEKHINELQIIFPHAEIKLVDGEMFSWYGSRLINAPAYFASMNHQ
ncbi:MAG: helical backbone metal receptor [bacterium]|nr:helical backbone metal receptor [bacterium]